MRGLAIVIVLPVILFTTVVAIAYAKQKTILQEIIETANKDLHGKVVVADSHIAPFANFPYISIDLEKVQIFEQGEVDSSRCLLSVNDLYLGFNLWDLINSRMQVKAIRMKDGFMHIVQHTDGTINISNALASKKPSEEVANDFHLELHDLELDNIDVSKWNEANDVLADVLIDKANASIAILPERFDIELESKFELSLLMSGDTTFIKHKHLDVDVDMIYDMVQSKVIFEPTEVRLEDVGFDFNGNVVLNENVDIDLHFTGNKPNFDLFMAMAPNELQPALEKFDNSGKIFFDVTVKGPSANGFQPAINANFGCENGYFNNTKTGRKMEEIGFKGSFTNGDSLNTSTMLFKLEQFTARPEAGTFSGKLVVQNFDAPDIDVNLLSDFDLDYLAGFFGLEELNGLDGRVALTMNFHDIIDFAHPEHAIQKMNESYFTELLIENLTFAAPDLDAPIRDLDVKATWQGHAAQIDYLNLQYGKSDINISGHVSDLPAIMHHTDDVISCDLNINSSLLDFKEITGFDKDSMVGVDEQLKDLAIKLRFNASARAFTESPHLPIGEFFIDQLNVKAQHYPHHLHDFHADVLISESDFKVIDFKGIIDQSDFHFDGRLENYPLWFGDQMVGDTHIDFDLTADHLHFDNLFTYKGDRFVPEEYRHEIAEHVKLHGDVRLHFDDSLKGIDLALDHFSGQIKAHHLAFKDFSGQVSYNPEVLDVRNFGGRMGHSDFRVDLHHALKSDANTISSLKISGNHLDMDELMEDQSKATASASSTTVTGSTNTVEASPHDEVFSLYDFDFIDIDLACDLGHFNYHHHDLAHFKANARMRKGHIIHLDRMDFDAAGGHFDLKGKLSGEDKQHIYFEPDIQLTNVDLDKFMIKFENFGQDHLVAENIHGKCTTHITGKIHLHADLVPKMDDSEVFMDVLLLDGRLENYEPIQAMAEYFQNKDLSKVYFDTLSNTITMRNEVIDIPRMTINSSIGFMEIKGKQHMNDAMDMDYVIGIPWKMIGEVAGSKLFGRKKNEPENNDEIIYRRENERLVYIKMNGNPDNFKVSLTRKSKS